MRVRAVLGMVLLALSGWAILQAQKPFRAYYGAEYADFPLPPDWNQPAEWTRARLRYRALFVVHGGPTNPGQWTVDYPRSDRHLLQGVRRLTRIDTRSVEQVVDLDGSDDIYNWPFLYTVEPGHWNLSEDEGRQLREYLL